MHKPTMTHDEIRARLQFARYGFDAIYEDSKDPAIKAANDYLFEILAADWVVSNDEPLKAA